MGNNTRTPQMPANILAATPSNYKQLSVTVVELRTKEEWRITVRAHEHVAPSICARVVAAFRVDRVVYSGEELDLLDTWEAIGIEDEGKIYAETLSKDERLASATPREEAYALIDDILALNDGLSWIGLGLRRLPKRFWNMRVTAAGHVNLSNNPITCKCCRERAGLAAQPEQVCMLASLPTFSTFFQFKAQ